MTETEEQLHSRLIREMKYNTFNVEKFKASSVEKCVQASKCVQVEKSQVSVLEAKVAWLTSMVDMINTGDQQVFDAFKDTLSHRDNFASKHIICKDIYGKDKEEQFVLRFCEKILAYPLEERTRLVMDRIKIIFENFKHNLEDSRGMVETFQMKADYWRGAYKFDMEMMNDAHQKLNVAQAESLDEMMDMCRDGVAWSLTDDGRDEKFKSFAEGKDSDTKEKRDARTIKGEEETMLDYSKRIKMGYEIRVAVMECVQRTLDELE